MGDECILDFICQGKHLDIKPVKIENNVKSLLQKQKTASCN